jgi:hypothetical protein
MDANGYVLLIVERLLAGKTNDQEESLASPMVIANDAR